MRIQRAAIYDRPGHRRAPRRRDSTALAKATTSDVRVGGTEVYPTAEQLRQRPHEPSEACEHPLRLNPSASTGEAWQSIGTGSRLERLWHGSSLRVLSVGHCRLKCQERLLALPCPCLKRLDVFSETEKARGPISRERRPARG